MRIRRGVYAVDHPRNAPLARFKGRSHLQTNVNTTAAVHEKKKILLIRMIAVYSGR